MRGQLGAWMAAFLGFAPCALAQGAGTTLPLIAVSADIVEISGSMSTNIGVNWNTAFAFSESALPYGLIKLGDFARTTKLQANLNLLLSEGKAQILTNPKVLVVSNEMATFSVGVRVPFPAANYQGVSIIPTNVYSTLKVRPSVDPNSKDRIGATFELDLQNLDYSQTIAIPSANGQTNMPTITTRSMRSSLFIKSGETVVMGGFKQSNYSKTTVRVPLLGSIPILGRLFTNTQMSRTESTIYIFLTMEMVK